MARQTSTRETEEIQEATGEAGTDPAVIAAAGSVMLSWYYFFAKGEREKGLFVGLWPPTILAFASYFAQTKMSDRIENAMGTSRTASGIGQSVREMVGNP